MTFAQIIRSNYHTRIMPAFDDAVGNFCGGCQMHLEFNASKIPNSIKQRRLQTNPNKLQYSHTIRI